MSVHSRQLTLDCLSIFFNLVYILQPYTSLIQNRVQYDHLSIVRVRIDIAIALQYMRACVRMPIATSYAYVFIRLPDRIPTERLQTPTSWIPRAIVSVWTGLQ